MHHHQSVSSVASGGKVLLNVQLARYFSERPVGCLRAALPSWLNLLRPGQRLAAKFKSFGYEFLGKRGRRLNSGGASGSRSSSPMSTARAVSCESKRLEKVWLADVLFPCNSG